MGGACGTHGDMKNSYKILAEKLEGKRSLRRPRSRWEVNIKVNLREIETGEVDWTELA
jgi:hypothetical protein